MSGPGSCGCMSVPCWCCQGRAVCSESFVLFLGITSTLLTDGGLLHGDKDIKWALPPAWGCSSPSSMMDGERSSHENQQQAQHRALVLRGVQSTAENPLWCSFGGVGGAEVLTQSSCNRCTTELFSFKHDLELCSYKKLHCQLLLLFFYISLSL